MDEQPGQPVVNPRVANIIVAVSSVVGLVCLVVLFIMDRDDPSRTLARLLPSEQQPADIPVWVQLSVAIVMWVSFATAVSMLLLKWTRR